MSEIRRSSTMFNSTNSYPSQPNSQHVLNDLSSFEGSSWSILAAQFKSASDSSVNDSSSPPYASQPLNSRKACESMKLKKDDIPIYGLCPARDQFFVTNCDHCGQVVKYQALSAHIELRHSAVTSHANSVLSNIETPPPSTRSDASSGSTSSLSNPLSTSDTDFCPISSGVAFNTGPGISSFSRLTPSPGIESPQPLHPANSSTLGSSNLPSAAAAASANSQSNQAAKSTDSSQSSACGTYNSGSEGLSILRASPSSLKSKFASSSSRSSSPSINNNNSSNTQSGKGKSDKKEKLLPCKDRQYDPDKHCGVKTDSMDKECTRSLTCKTHSLTLRRQVTGRVKSFDDLLEEHRRTKDEALRLAGKEPKLTKKQLKLKELEAKKAAGTIANVKTEKDSTLTSTASGAVTTSIVNVTSSGTSKSLSTCSTSSIIASPSPIGSVSSECGDLSPKVVNKGKSGSLLLATALSAPSLSTKLSIQSNLNARIQKKRDNELSNESSDVFVQSKRAHLESNIISPKSVMNSNGNVAHGTKSSLISSPSSNVSITSLGLSNNDGASGGKVTSCISNRLNAPLIVKSSHLPSPSTAPITVEGCNNIIYLKHPPRPLAVNSYNCRHLILSSSSNNSSNVNCNNPNSLGHRLHVDGTLDASLITSPLYGRTNDRMYTALSTVFQLDPKSSKFSSSSSPCKQQPPNSIDTSCSNNGTANGNNLIVGNNVTTINVKGTNLTRTVTSPFTSVPLGKLNTNTTPVTLINALTGGVSGATTATKISLSPSTMNAKRGKGNLQNQPTFTNINQLTKQEFVQPAAAAAAPAPAAAAVGQSNQFNQLQGQTVTATSSSILINSSPNLSQALFNRSGTQVTNQAVKRKLTPINNMSSFYSNQINSPAVASPRTPSSPSPGVNSNNNLLTNGPKVTRSLMGINAPSLISLLESGISNSNSGSITGITGNNNTSSLLLSNTSTPPFPPTLTPLNCAGINNTGNSGSGNNNSTNIVTNTLPFIASSSTNATGTSQGLLAASLSSPLKKVKVTGGNANITSGNNFTSAISTPTLESLLDAGIPGRTTSNDTLSVSSTTGLPGSLLISSRDSN